MSQPGSPSRSSLRTDRLVALGLAMLALAVYARTRAPSLLEIGDVNEFATVSYLFGIAHTTGYPLFTLLGAFFVRLPWGDLMDVAGRVNLMAGVLAALAVPAVFALCRQAGAGTFGAAVAAGIFAFGPAFWSTGIRADVHGLNAMFAALATCLLMRWGEATAGAVKEEADPWRRGMRYLVACAFVVGLSLTNHITTYLLAPGFVVYFLLRGRAFLRAPWRLAVPVVAFLVPLLLYLYIPLRGGQLMADPALAQDPAGIGIPLRISLGYVTPHYRSGGWPGFTNLVFAGDYVPSLMGVPWAEAPARLAAVPPILLRQMGAGSLAGAGVVLLAALGFVALARRKPREAALLGIVWLTMIAQVTRYDEPDLPVFLIPAYIMMAACAAVGIHAIVAVARSALAGRRGVAAGLALSAAFVALPVSQLVGNYGVSDRSNDWTIPRFTQEVLDLRLPHGAVLVGSGDETAALRYRQMVDGQRTDLVAVQAGFGTPRFYDIIERCRRKGLPVYLIQPFPPEERDAAPTRFPRKVVALPQYGDVHPQFAAYTNIAGKAALLGYDLNPERARPGHALHLRLYWRALVDIDGDYEMLVRLISGGRIVANIERTPISPWFPTHRWRSGQVFVDQVHMLLPADTPPGTYNLEVGWTQKQDLLPLVRADGKTETAPIVLRYVTVEP